MGKTKISERLHEDLLELIRNFTLFDDDYMSAFFEHNLKCAEYVLSILLERELTVKDVQTQKEIHNLQGRSVRLDVKAVDSENKLNNIEVQQLEKGAMPKRARYNAALLDANCADSGEYGENLPETYVIFITRFDKYKKGRAMYPVDRTVDLGDGKTVPFGDDLHIMYVNGAYDGDDKFGELLHDFRTSNPDEMHDSVLKEQAKYLKRDVKGVKTMCKAVEDFAEKRAMARVVERNAEIARDMLSENMPVETVAKISKLSMEKVLELKEQLVSA